MKIKSRHSMPSAESDMTPMIDMTFQLIAFFMVLINFGDAEVSELINLPHSELARPPDAPLETPITLQLTKQGTVLYAGDEFPVPQLRTPLQRERQVMERQRKPVSGATVVIRADANAKAGLVQEIIRIAQEVGMERFVLRAQQGGKKP